MGRSPCCDKKTFKKGPWIPEEDDKLIQYIHTHGPGNWRTLPYLAGLQRCGKSCRLRWTNYLRPDIKRGRFSFEEEESIIQLHSILGNKWSAIAARLPGRTDNEIKNYWNTHIRKRLLRNGIDPVTHCPRLDLLDLSSILASTQLNLSSLLGLQTVLNPDLASLLSTLLATTHENPNTLLQKIIQNQLMMMNCEMQNESCHIQSSPQFTSSSFPTQEIDSRNCQSYQQNLDPSHLDGSFGDQLPIILSNMCDQIKVDLTKISNYPPRDIDSSHVVTNQNVIESPLSMPIRSPSPLHPSSFFINSNSTIEYDQQENYQSDIFKFEIPESLDMDDFM